MSERQPLLSTSQSNSGREENRVTNLDFCDGLRAEFKGKNFLLSHPREDVFYSCQWDWAPGIFVFYRMVVASYALVILILGITDFHPKDPKRALPWPVFLTNWSFTVLTVYLLLAATIVILYSASRGRCCHRSSLRSSIHGFSPDNELDPSVTIIPLAPLPWFIKLEWILFNVASMSAVLVTIVYFSAIYPQTHHHRLSMSDGTLHISNSIIMLLEYLLCAVPIRLFHSIYGLIYGLIYIIFSIMYWAVNHDHVIYPHVLDWNKPARTFGVVITLTVLGIPLLQLIFFCLYRLRLFVYHQIYNGPRPQRKA